MALQANMGKYLFQLPDKFLVIYVGGKEMSKCKSSKSLGKSNKWPKDERNWPLKMP
jgi:hypothetical protein